MEELNEKIFALEKRLAQHDDAIAGVASATEEQFEKMAHDISNLATLPPKGKKY